MTVPSEDRDPVEVLASEFAQRRRQREQVTIDEYVARYPQWADEIRALFPTIDALEHLRVRSDASNTRGPLDGIAKLKQIGDFRIVAEIGRGGMGVVYLAEQLSLGRRVALKVLPRQTLLDAKRLHRFRREAQMAARLHHTNIIPVFGVGEHDGYHFIVMQFIEGVGLDEFLRQVSCRTGSLTGVATEPADGSEPAQRPDIEAYQATVTSLIRELDTPAYYKRVAAMGQQVADALQYAHQQGTLHRDIKPANLLIDRSGIVWVADFGLAKAVQGDDISHPGDLVGTLRYMAPERFEGRADRRSDLYSLGLTLYELLTRQPAFADSDYNRLIQRMLHAAPLRPRSVNPEIPADLETIVLKATAREAEHRYQTAGELADDLRRFVDDRTIKARRSSFLERTWRWCRRNRAVASLTAVALGLLLLTAVVASVGYVRTRRALEGETAQREKAEATSQLALEVLDQIYRQFAPDRTLDVAGPPVDAEPDAEEGRDANRDLETTDEPEDAYQLPVQPVLSNETASLLESMLVFYDRLAAQEGIDENTFREKAAEANGRVGDIHQRLGQFDQAEKAYARAIASYQQLVIDDPENVALHIELARMHNALGRVYRRARRWDEGRACHRRSLAILTGLAKEPANRPEIQYELARTHYDLGHRGRPGPRGPSRPHATRRENGVSGVSAADAGIAHFQTAIGLLNGLVAAGTTRPDYRHLLAVTYRDMSYRLDEPEASAARARATEILEALVHDYPEMADYRFDLARTYFHVRPYHRRRGLQKKQRVPPRMQQAVELMERLVAEHPNVPDYTAFLAMLLDRQAGQLSRAGHRRAAEETYRRETDLLQRLVDRFPHVMTYSLGLAWSRHSLAHLERQLGRLDAARSSLDAALRTLDLFLTRYAGTMPAVRVARNMHYAALITLAQLLEQQGQVAEAAEVTRRAETERAQWHLQPRRKRRSPGGRRPSRGRGKPPVEPNPGPPRPPAQGTL